MKRNTFFLFFTLLAFSTNMLAQIPSGYYDGAEGLSGEALKSELHQIIKGHTTYSYNDLRDFILKNTDEDPNNSNNVILLYTGRSQAKSTFGGNANDWNREHVWAKSHGNFGTTPPAGTDAHHLRPTDASVNSTRGNLDFDMGGNPISEAPGCFVDGDSFEPRDAVKGDVARMIFYMATRYEGGNGEPDLEVVDRVNTSPAPEHGKLSVLIQWNLQDPPDDFERHRNDVIHYQYQHNRNPFIDHPEYVDAIWGDPSAMQMIGLSPIVAYPNPTTGSVTLNGLDGSYTYTVTTVYGNIIEDGMITRQDSKIDLSFAASGVYLVNILNQNSQQVSQVKVVKLTR
ncbi:MAG: endonuclease [Bacteroidales bacterium]|nr:endonuclease [Bacteroidales bacterium]